MAVTCCEHRASVHKEGIGCHACQDGHELVEDDG
jgi:hypothetical protein